MQKSYFQDSITLKKELDRKQIPSNAQFFICDATSMYTNTRTGLSLHRIGQFALKNAKHMAVPPEVLMDALILLMTNNAFQFGDTYWLQNVVKAMGAPPAPPLGHDLLWYSQRGSACSIRRHDPILLLFYRRRPRNFSSQSRLSQRSPKMDCV